MRKLLRQLLGYEAEAVVVHFASGPVERVRAMYEEIRALEPAREHYVVSLGEPLGFGLPIVLHAPSLPELRMQLGPKRIGLAPFLLGPDPLCRLVWQAAPRKMLAFNARGERHHLRLRTLLASALFAAGLPLDRIWLRPWWWPWARERSRPAGPGVTLSGRELGGRPRIAILSPYYPWPLGHGGAVRIYSLLREAAKEFDIWLYCFAEPGCAESPGPVLELVHEAVLFPLPRYREPRWASLLPPEVREYESPAVRERLARDRAKWQLLQVEYTYLARYPGDVLVEHDVTFDLYQQMGARWSAWRWRRFERAALRRFRRVMAMAEKDAAMLADPKRVRVLPNGVDLDRFRPAPEPAGQRVLFVGSFRHFPNVTAFRFLWEEVWPRVVAEEPGAVLTVIAGPRPELYAEIPGAGLDFHGFVADVVPFYEAANLVVAPTLVSAGTNLKVLEAMAMRRAVVATPSGCDGLGLRHGESVWVAAEAAALAAGIVLLLRDRARREALARRAAEIAVERFGWDAIGREQARLWRELL
jgi:glycosyltransferase involved in cell wall biosynthesis